MNTNVIVTGDEIGNTIIKSSNPEYGHIRLEQSRMVVDTNGFASVKKVSALLLGTIVDLMHFDLKLGQSLEGRIMIKEALYPFNKREPERDLKIAGDSGIICSVNGKSIYRKAIFSMVSTIEDVLIEHDNGSEMQEFYEQQAIDTSIETETLSDVQPPVQLTDL